MSEKSQILIPYISHNNINHQYFIQYKVNGELIYYKVASGIYPEFTGDDSSAYLKLVEPLLLYDKVFITYDDFLYLYKKVDFKSLLTLLDDEILTLVNTESFRFIHNYNPVKKHLFFSTDRGQAGKSGYIKNLNDMPAQLKNKMSRRILTIGNSKEFIDNIIRFSNDELKDPNILQLLELVSPDERCNEIYRNTYEYNKVYYSNYFCSLAAKIGVENIFQDSTIYNLIEKKIYANINKVSDYHLEKAFKEVVRFERLPDIPSLIFSQRLSFRDILKIRNSKNGENFRKWLRETLEVSITDDSPQLDVNQFLSLYHEACLEQSAFQKIRDGVPFKVGESIVSLALGAMVPGSGVFTSSSSLLLSLIGNGWRPHFFIRDLEKRSTHT